MTFISDSICGKLRVGSVSGGIVIMVSDSEVRVFGLEHLNYFKVFLIR